MKRKKKRTNTPVLRRFVNPNNRKQFVIYADGITDPSLRISKGILFNASLKGWVVVEAGEVSTLDGSKTNPEWNLTPDGWQEFYAGEDGCFPREEGYPHFEPWSNDIASKAFFPVGGKFGIEGLEVRTKYVAIDTKC